MNPLRLKFPVVLVHGLGAQNTYGPFEYFYGIPQILRQAGNSVVCPRLTAWKRIEYRANELQVQIEAAFPDQKINLIGHSLGGLDARYLAAQPNFQDRVASVTTIGTPHRGSPLANLATTSLPWLNKMDSIAIKQVTREFCTEALEKIAPKISNVAYFSAHTCIAQPILLKALPIFWPTHSYIKKLEGENDGFVSLESAQWGELIHLDQGDHYAQVGQILGHTRGLNHIRFYETIFRRLKLEGF